MHQSFDKIHYRFYYTKCTNLRALPVTSQTNYDIIHEFMVDMCAMFDEDALDD